MTYKNTLIHELGYTDEQLESKASIEGVDVGNAPWVYWTSELYSVGRLYRELVWYPKRLPLYIYSDHGIHTSSELAKHEMENDSNIHFTFNPERQKRYEGTGKNVQLIQHPWISYRKKQNYQPLPTAKGTLVFISHSSTSVEWLEKDQDGYFEDLLSLPDEYQPLVLCMHMHDINKKYHLHYRKFGLPILTCGNTSSVHFVDEFYRIATQFKYGTSNTAGSQLYYCIEMGMPYFLYGDTPDLLNKDDPNLPIGLYRHTNEVASQIHDIEQKIFRGLPQSITLEQKIFAEWVLGNGSKISRVRIFFIIWGQFIKNMPSFLKLIIDFIKRRWCRFE